MLRKIINYLKLVTYGKIAWFYKSEIDIGPIIKKDIKGNFKVVIMFENGQRVVFSHNIWEINEPLYIG